MVGKKLCSSFVLSIIHSLVEVELLKNEQAKAVVDRFHQDGDITVSKLETQLDLKDGDYLMTVHYMPGVFPMTISTSSERSMVIYVDRNFKDIFEFFKLESGWETVDEGSAEKPAQRERCVEVRGPSGSGKNVVFSLNFVNFLCFQANRRLPLRL